MDEDAVGQVVHVLTREPEVDEGNRFLQPRNARKALLKVILNRLHVMARAQLDLLDLSNIALPETLKHRPKCFLLGRIQAEFTNLLELSKRNEVGDLHLYPSEHQCVLAEERSQCIDDRCVAAVEGAKGMLHTPSIAECYAAA